MLARHLLSCALPALVPLEVPRPARVAPARVEREASRSVRILATANAPEIDGFLEPEVWERAPAIGALTQLEPVEGAAPSFESDVRLLFDADNLYIGMRFFDPEPERIIGTTRDFDAFLDADDRVELVLDTFHDHRSAYFFQINATGSKGDALVTGNGSGFNKPWDGIWQGAARIDERGWSAELALPFKTLSFDAHSTTWGFNLTRYIGRKRETCQWAGERRNQRLFQIVHAGEILGLEGMRQGLGLDLVPFFVGSWQRDFEEPDTDWLGHAGMDAFYKLTPNLSLSLTLNTDFAETEVDQRRINLTRFPLFFPERRDFFVQDAGRFAFASNGVTPFFSRRIGLDSSGAEVPLLAGGKLSGRAGPFALGILGVETKRTDELDGQSLMAARVALDVGQQSSIGAIVTHGDPSGETRNVVAGLDAKLRTSEFLGDANLEGTLWALHSDSEDESGQDSAFGAGINYPNDDWRWYANAREIQANFDARLGFVPRRGIRGYNSGLSWLPRIDERIRRLEFGVDVFTVTDIEDELQSRTVELQPFGVYFESGDEFRVELERTREVLSADFDIRDDVRIPAGEYDFSRWRLEWVASSTRSLGGKATVEGGDFFDGERRDLVLQADWRSGALLQTSLGFERNEVRLEDGGFDTELVFATTKVSFTPEVGWNTTVQWDNASDSWGLNSRLRWIPVPGQEVFVVFDQRLEGAEHERYAPEFQSLAFKLAYTLRF